MDNQSPQNSQDNSEHMNQKQTNQKPIHQPLQAEDVSPDQKKRDKDVIANENPTVNPGDRVTREMSLEEKSQEVSVNAPDITGDHIVVPTYFIVDDPEEGQKALHHVKDAEEISDVIRQARVDESGERTWW